MSKKIKDFIFNHKPLVIGLSALAILIVVIVVTNQPKGPALKGELTTAPTFNVPIFTNTGTTGSKNLQIADDAQNQAMVAGEQQTSDKMIAETDNSASTANPTHQEDTTQSNCVTTYDAAGVPQTVCNNDGNTITDKEVSEFNNDVNSKESTTIADSRATESTNNDVADRQISEFNNRYNDVATLDTSREVPTERGTAPSSSDSASSDSTSRDSSTVTETQRSTSTTTSTSGSERVTATTSDRCAGFKDLAKTDRRCPAVEYMKKIGAMTGNPDGTIDLSGYLQRDQVAKIILMVMAKYKSATNYCGVNNPFKDVETNAWARQYICRAKTLGIVTGYLGGEEKGMYLSARNMSRVEFLAVILRNFEAQMPKDYLVSYRDADANDWYAKYAKFSKDNNLVSGNYLKPSEPITRGEVAEITYKIFKLGMLD